MACRGPTRSSTHSSNAQQNDADPMMSRPPSNRPGPPPEFQRAVEHHRAGRLPEAESLYRDLIRKSPRAAEPHGLLGFLRYQFGDYETALEFVDKAIELNAGFTEAHVWRGMVLQATARFSEAEASYRKALSLNPRHADALINLGSALVLQDRPAEALDPLRQALTIQGNRPEAQFGLARARFALNQIEAAVEGFQHALRLRPDYVEALSNLGVALIELHRVDEAIVCLRRALALNPIRPELHFNLGRALRDGPDAEAIERHLRDALEIQPEYPEARVELAQLLLNLGRREEAVEHLRYTVETSPESAVAISALLMTLNYDPDMTPDALAQEHRQLGAAISARAPAFPRRVRQAAEPDRRLRLGYLSPDFRAHSCAYFIEPLFQAHDRTQFELFAYSTVPAEDGVTARLKALVDQWRPVRLWAEEAVADQMAKDGIDILVDLAGHTSGGRPRLLAMKPAPLLFTWLGYPNSTGLEAVDYRITDAIADPPGAGDDRYVERLLRLPGGFLCYRPPADAPEPALHGPSVRGTPVFGCFNTAAKLNASVAGLWSRILTAVPGSRLKLRAHQFQYPAAVEATRRLFAAAGLDPARLDLSPWRRTVAEGLKDYDDVDLALDPFPYNGTTTTCEALWMGVPVVSLAGQSHAGRVGASILTAAGIQDRCLAQSLDDYVCKAVALIGDRTQLADWRAQLRRSLATTTLMEPRRFAREMEGVLRTCWKDLCSRSRDA
jgi:protein O-GlcNAc transferase